MAAYYEEAAAQWYRDAYAEGKMLRRYSDAPCSALVEFTQSPYFPKDGAVVDYACGEGIDAVHLARQGCRVVGIDVAADAIVKARQLAAKAGVTAQFDVGDMISCPGLPSGQFDLALAIACFGWLLEDAHRAAFLRETARVLKPGGWLFFNNGILFREIEQSFPEVYAKLRERPQFEEWLKEERAGRYVSPSQRYETREGYEQLLKEAGYVIIHTHLDVSENAWGIVIWARKQ
jgi:ubiquinone/menaquinone biosynthesis C-methylase UbiE